MIRRTTDRREACSSRRNTAPMFGMAQLRAVAGDGVADGGKLVPNNNVQRFREHLMMSKAELARKAGLSTLTIDRVEAGRPCRLDTKRKILLALGMRTTDKDQVFGNVVVATAAIAVSADAATHS